MKRLVLGLPVVFVGIPLLIAVLVASAPRQDAPDAGGPARPKVVIKDDGERLPDTVEMERLADADPVAFLENCLRRYDREVHGYHATMQKKERLAGDLKPKEVVDLWVREKPFSTLLRWRVGARKAERAMYVEGENDGKMLARPNGFFARKVAGNVVVRDVAGSDARQSGRYPLSESGIKKGTERTLAAWKAAQSEGKLHARHFPDQRVKEAGDRLCFKLRRTYESPEGDGVTELTIFVDKENWLQVGSILKGKGGTPIGEYYFRDIELNASFPPSLFTRASLEAD